MNTIRYNGHNIYVSLGNMRNRANNLWEFPVYLIVRKNLNLAIFGVPRVGKSAIVKPATAKISKHRKCCIFDYNGEWSNSVTRYNMESEEPSRLVGYKVLKNFTFKVSAFNNKNDWAALGFRHDMQEEVMSRVINLTAHEHKNDVNKIATILAAIPIRDDDVGKFNELYSGKEPIFQKFVNSSTASAISTRWAIMKKCFWQGPEDTRPVYDFAQEFIKINHLIVDLSNEGFELGDSESLKRAFCGKVLEQLRSVWLRTKAIYIFEESRKLFPNESEQMVMLSSNKEGYNLLVDGPKTGNIAWIIAQSPNQIFQRFLENLHIKILGVMNPPPQGREYELVNNLEFDPEQNIREFVLLDVNCIGKNMEWNLKYFRPGVPCCQFNSDR